VTISESPSTSVRPVISRDEIGLVDLVIYKFCKVFYKKEIDKLKTEIKQIKIIIRISKKVH